MYVRARVCAYIPVIERVISICSLTEYSHFMKNTLPKLMFIYSFGFAFTRQNIKAGVIRYVLFNIRAGVLSHIHYIASTLNSFKTIRFIPILSICFRKNF